MGKLQERYCQLAMAVYLWAQRRKWPVSNAFRHALRGILARGINPAMPDLTEEWSRPLFGNTNGQTVSPVFGDEGTRTIQVDRARHSTFKVSVAAPRLRCAIASWTMDFGDFGGLDRVAGVLARRLPSYGLETVAVNTIDTEKGNGASESELARGLRADNIPFFTVSARDSMKWLQDHRPDVVNVHGSTPDWFVTDAAAVGIPIVETLHGSHSFFDPVTWPAERLRSKQIAGFVAVSDVVRKQYLVANPQYPPEQVITIPNAIDDTHIVHRDRAQARKWLGLRDEFLFVSLGRYHLQKNTFALISAFSDVARDFPDVHLLVAGHRNDIAYFEQIRRLRDSLSSANQIHLRGHSSDPSMLLAAADAFVLDSFFEGGPLVSMEALCAGVPVIISDVGAAREQVGDDFRRGYVVRNPLGDQEVIDWQKMSQARFETQINRAELVNAMRAVIADRDKWRAVRNDLMLESMERFSTDAWVQRHADALKRFALSKRPLLLASINEH